MLGWLGMCWDLLIAALAMHALKQSLGVPERMGWNGDPCAPTVWDAWQGVTCNLAADGSSLIITQMYVWVFSTTSNLTTLFLSSCGFCLDLLLGQQPKGSFSSVREILKTHK